MKNFIKIALINAIILIGGFGFCNPVLAEQINDYQVQIRVNADSSLDVREAIVYDFNDLPKHGIYRYIPIQYSRDNFAYNLRISNISVKDENGQDYESNSYYSNNNLEIKIDHISEKYVSVGFDIQTPSKTSCTMSTSGGNIDITNVDDLYYQVRFYITKIDGFEVNKRWGDHYDLEDGMFI